MVQLHAQVHLSTVVKLTSYKSGSYLPGRVASAEAALPLTGVLGAVAVEGASTEPRTEPDTESVKFELSSTELPSCCCCCSKS
jgi:hypothetical protein